MERTRVIDRDASANTWTVAYRNPRANHFKRVTDWSGTWDEACQMAGRVGAAHPELEVWYTSTKASEDAGWVHPDDCGNILVPSKRSRYASRRVQMRETGRLSDVLTLPTQAAAEAGRSMIEQAAAKLGFDLAAAEVESISIAPAGATEDMVAEAVIERCKRAGHDHVTPNHEPPSAQPFQCWFESWAGQTVSVFVDGEWERGTVGGMTWRMDGVTVTLIEDPGYHMRATWNEIDSPEVAKMTAADGRRYGIYGNAASWTAAALGESRDV